MSQAVVSRPHSQPSGARAFSELLLFIRLMAHNPAGFVGFVGVIGFVVFSFVGPLLVPLDMTPNLTKIYQPPSWEYPLGTDYQGRNVLPQIVHGGRDVLVVAFLAAAMSTLIAVFFGALSAFVGGTADSAITFVTDVFLTIPTVPLFLVIASFVRLNNMPLLAVLMAALSWPVLLRAVRSQVFSLKERDYVEAARALDLGTRHIIFGEIVPNMLSYIAIAFVLAMTNAIYLQVGLVFLGLVPISDNNWGVMVQLAWVRGAIFYKDSIAYIVAPILAISLFQLALVTMTRSLEEVFNPRLRTGA